MAVETPPAELGAACPDFRLPAVDGKSYARDDFRAKPVLVVMFICNHCPYVKAVVDRIVRDCLELRQHGIEAIAISSNDVVAYPEDSFEHMQEFAKQHRFPFPYAWDESQEVAKAYGAVCTPDFYGFNADLGLQYRGRLDESRNKPAPPDVRRELFEAMVQVAKTGQGPLEQIPSIGCSMKWRAGSP